jgi:hypothetical protein
MARDNQRTTDVWLRRGGQGSSAGNSGTASKRPGNGIAPPRALSGRGGSPYPNTRRKSSGGRRAW